MRYFGLIFCLNLLVGQALAQCPPRPDAAPRLDSMEFLVMEKYLARAVAMNGLTDELVPAPFAWNGTPDNQPCYRGGDRSAIASYDSAASCGGRCYFHFCPSNFAADVAVLVRLRASLVQFAASTWDSPELFRPGSDFLNAARQTVERINAAYDCAGLRHPLVQASVFESIGIGPVCGATDSAGLRCSTEPGGWPRPGPPGTNSGVNGVKIPPAVIAEFADELQSPADRAYYFGADGQPRQELRFNFFRIAYPIWGFYSPDITRPEGKLWVYYQATCYLDAGYTALHMGQPRLWGRLADMTLTERTVGLQQVAKLMNRIRRYARQRPGSPAPFVVLMAESMLDPLNYNATLVKFMTGRRNGRDQLIFDAQQAAMWPREVRPQVDEQGTAGGSMQCPAIDTARLFRLRCTGQYLSTIDPCHAFTFAPDGGGHTPVGITYEGHTPYGVYFDHSITVLRLPNGKPKPVPVLTPGNNSSWGWDDAAWFTAALTDTCQADWLTYQLQRVRSFSNAKGFLIAPGRLYNNYSVGVLDYRLAAHPLALAAIEKAWQPAVPAVQLRQQARGLRVARSPQQTPGGPPCRRQRLPRWHLRVNNPDVTSIYSWRLRRPDGNWQAVAVGDSLDLRPGTAGRYALYLRQDNLGLDPTTGGSRLWAVATLPAAEPQCFGRKGFLARRYVVPPPVQGPAELRPITDPAEQATLHANWILGMSPR